MAFGQQNEICRFGPVDQMSLSLSVHASSNFSLSCNLWPMQGTALVFYMHVP